ncbi:uncharacterized protein LOC128958009 [Oppia nitens]|uniref:uncharacterized protein LOC128958009 n=1 Tax=Oppia nitens TaxID=1686743 RepID=UPI0023DC8ED6|nr:uncharacterized protein LOC128958009 [Oppia nitens]
MKIILTLALLVVTIAVVCNAQTAAYDESAEAIESSVDQETSTDHDDLDEQLRKKRFLSNVFKQVADAGTGMFGQGLDMFGKLAETGMNAVDQGMGMTEKLVNQGVEIGTKMVKQPMADHDDLDEQLRKKRFVDLIKSMANMGTGMLGQGLDMMGKVADTGMNTVGQGLNMATGLASKGLGMGKQMMDKGFGMANQATGLVDGITGSNGRRQGNGGYRNKNRKQKQRQQKQQEEVDDENVDNN